MNPMKKINKTLEQRIMEEMNDIEYEAFQLKRRQATEAKYKKVIEVLARSFAWILSACLIDFAIKGIHAGQDNSLYYLILILTGGILYGSFKKYY